MAYQTAAWHASDPETKLKMQAKHQAVQVELKICDLTLKSYGILPEIPSELRILSDPAKQLELIKWENAGGDREILMDFLKKELAIMDQYVTFYHDMRLTHKQDIPSFESFKAHTKRHMEYAEYCKKLLEENGPKFIKEGGGRTYEEFDIMRCREISKRDNTLYDALNRG